MSQFQINQVIHEPIGNCATETEVEYSVQDSCKIYPDCVYADYNGKAQKRHSKQTGQTIYRNAPMFIAVCSTSGKHSSKKCIQFCVSPISSQTLNHHNRPLLLHSLRTIWHPKTLCVVVHFAPWSILLWFHQEMNYVHILF